MGDVGKTLIALGAILVILGVIFLLAQKVSFLGKLPGDIVIRRENFTLYFPLGTSILISIILSLLLFLTGKFR
jgi:hypothetical protein